MRKLIVLVLALTMAFTGPAMAGTLIGDPDSSVMHEKMTGMLVRGVTDISVSGLHIIEGGVKGTTDGTFLLGTLQGIGQGTVKTIDRAGRGVLDVVGSLIPGYHGSPSTHELEMLKF